VSTSTLSPEKREQVAWAAYREDLRDLAGAAYEEAEGESWERLQRELQDIERDRAAGGARPGAPD